MKTKQEKDSAAVHIQERFSPWKSLKQIIIDGVSLKKDNILAVVKGSILFFFLVNYWYTKSGAENTFLKDQRQNSDVQVSPKMSET